MRLCVLLLSLLLVFIWGNSLLPGETSGAISHWLQSLLARIFPGFRPGKEDTGHHLLRKLAHFSEFCCLGLCLSWLFRMLRKPTAAHLLLPLLGGTLVALTDETIQCFVPGRGPGLLDVGIDVLGISLGIACISIIYWLYAKNKKKYLEEM